MQINDTLLEVKDLRKSFGKKEVLRGVNFAVKKGELVGLIGPNGSGKSTTIKSLLRFYKTDNGKVFFNGRQINSVQDIASEISYIPDIPIYYENLTVMENLNLTAMINNISKNDFTKRKDAIVQKFQLQDFLDVLPDTLSRGTKQKLSLACGLIKNYLMLIADEPFDGLDPEQIRILKDIFLEQKNSGRSVLLSTHLLGLVETFCDRFLILYEGKIVAQGSQKEICEQYCLEEENIGMEAVYLKIIGKIKNKRGINQC
jgi:ABC-2 type transport system ATP-binding protein